MDIITFVYLCTDTICIYLVIHKRMKSWSKQGLFDLNLSIERMWANVPRLSIHHRETVLAQTLNIADSDTLHTIMQANTQTHTHTQTLLLFHIYSNSNILTFLINKHSYLLTSNRRLLSFRIKNICIQYIYIYIYSEMESYEGSRDRSLEFACFAELCVVLALFASFWSVHLRRFGSCPVQIFRQSNLNLKPNLYQIPVVISKLSIYIYVYIYTYMNLYMI